ncbi:hypothetical protein NDU88_007503 [Pleurodeles waltl]|uniref:Uncharacterized protein n=1 Tax=Pleurodeles waltl TaxID=8319 RepID=A0AAV7N744_PLEWA|nr:hypothetical protein NDU88_007503 [Pleurodeles waltl]
MPGGLEVPRSRRQGRTRADPTCGLPFELSPHWHFALVAGGPGLELLRPLWASEIILDPPPGGQELDEQCRLNEALCFSAALLIEAELKFAQKVDVFDVVGELLYYISFNYF